MDKFRNFKNRLSVSVDKLSPHRRAISPLPSNRKSVGRESPREGETSISTSTEPISGVIPSPDVPVRRNRNRSARPVSMDESDVEDSHSGSSALRPKAALKTTFPAAEPTASVKLDPGTENLVLEVMKEVEKIGTITDGINSNSKEVDSSACEKLNCVKKLEDNLEFIDSADEHCEEGEETISSLTLKHDRSAADIRDTSEMSLQLSTKDPCLSVSSTLHAESMTSGYFTDSTPEISTVSKPKPAATVFATLSNIEGKPPPKKESIYSKLLKKKEKEKEETKQKEPLYARIKPKLKVDTGFKPIDPSISEGTSQDSPVIKPEPIYSKVKPRIPCSPATPSSPASPIYSGSPRSSFVPLSPTGEPVYSKTTPKSSTLPIVTTATEPMDKGAKTLPKDIPMFSPRAKYPIYNQPLPAVPGSQDDHKRGRQMKSVPDSYSATVTVREKEISPVRANLITISNSTFVPSPPLSPEVHHSAFNSGSSSTSTKTTNASLYSSFSAVTPPVSPQRIARASRLTSSNASIENSNRKSQDFSMLPPPKAPKSTKEKRRYSNDRGTESSLASRETITTDSCLSLGSNPVETSGRVLSKLVEELSVELEAVSRRLGNQVCSDDDAKKEVLSKLLATYDVPKNLRRVAEVDEEEVLRSERFMIPVSSSDELRLVGASDDHADMFYADIPDYSHDEFVIALDDENDPKYATLTNEMRQRQSRSLVDMSPGKVSRRSAQVYLNVVNVLSALKILVNSNSARAAGVITRMGTLARPYAKKVQSSVQTSVQDTSWIQRKIYHATGHNGFDELRRYIKGGGEFCKELAVILQERAELESAYAKGLHKLAGKLVKASRDSLGSVHQAWQAVGQELDSEADVHRVLAAALAEEVTRPLRQLLDTQHKVRKGVEGMVDKTTRNVHEWRTAEYKAKKQSHSACRENEKIQDMALEARLGRGKTLSDKETVKMEKQRRKAEELVQRSEAEYYTCAVRAERARLEWESAIYKGTTCFQTLEEERLGALKQLVEKYQQNIKIAAPKMAEGASRLEEPVSQCDVEKDVATIINAKGTGENIPHQLLPDFYAEDINNIMNRERRRESLEKLNKSFKGDIERERRGKQGVENLAKALQETPNFGGEDSQQDVNDKLQHMRAMLAYLEAARHKVQCSLAELEHRPRPSHPVERHVHTSRDKQGMMVSVLKVPAWLTPDSASPDRSPQSASPADSPDWRDRGAGDGTSVQPDSDFDEFSSQGSDREYQNAITSIGADVARNNIVNQPSNHTDCDQITKYANHATTAAEVPEAEAELATARAAEAEQTSEDQNPIAAIGFYATQPPPNDAVEAMGRCKALYDYDANMYDELTIRTGDIIQLHRKQPDGWWVGELDGNVGIFPATYVEEID